MERGIKDRKLVALMVNDLGIAEVEVSLTWEEKRLLRFRSQLPWC
jgi:hypothetical protein